MPQPKRVESKVVSILTKAAAALPDVSTGIACAGTSLESKTFTVAKKAFLFVGPKDARLKLSASLDEAQRLSKLMPSSIRVGSNGWVTLGRDVAELDAPVLSRWVKESYQLFGATAASKRTTKKPQPKSTRKK